MKRKFPRRVMPEVKELFERADALGVSMLSLCKELDVHHSVPNNWRLGRTTPTLKAYLAFKRELERIAGSRDD
jgi:hypothetical protein